MARPEDKMIGSNQEKFSILVKCGALKIFGGD